MLITDKTISFRLDKIKTLAEYTATDFVDLYSL